MAQEFHVVRCFTCQSFQVQQVKKAKKWICKLCGHKQSLIKEFGRGSAADCRRHVQKLNAMRGALMEEAERDALLLGELEEEEEPKEPQERPVHFSRWDKYMNTPEEKELKEKQPKENVMDMRQLHNIKLTNRKRRRSETEREEERKPAQCQSLLEPEPAAKTRTSSVGQTTLLPGADCQAQERTKPSGSATTKPRLLIPVPSMFESGEDFSFDDLDYLTDQRV